MSYAFNLLTNHNLGLLRQRPETRHVLNYSIFKQVELISTFRGFSIIFVSEGVECHTVNGRQHKVGANEFLLGNPHCDGNAVVNSREDVHGLCIDLLPETVAEVLASVLHPYDPDRKTNLTSMLHGGDFFEYHNRSTESELSRFLAPYCRRMRLHPHSAPDLNEAFFYRLIELYIGEYEQIVKRIRSIPAVKISTRKEMLRQVTMGKTFMDDCFADDIRIQDVARASNMSRYHFFRLFRAAFGISPHQYLCQKRLQNGRELLLSGQAPVFDVALRCGFADLPSFSKAFKRRFGVCPSDI